MNLKSFGCSFIFGTDLNSATQPNSRIHPSQLTWPAHLANHLGRAYKCYARPASGNLQILEKVLNRVHTSNESDLFVIGWTWIDRFDYYPSVPATPGQTPWRTVMPSDADDLSKVYYRDLHSEYRDKLTCLSYIKLAIDTLNQKNIPFIMTYMDRLLFDQQWHVSPAVKDLQEYIKPHMTEFNGKTFLEWSRENGYPESESWHPLHTAHKEAGDYIIKIFGQPNTISITQ